MQEPETPEEWQTALDTIVALLAIDAARRYGLAQTNVPRCGEILRRAKLLGYRPSPAAIVAAIRVPKACPGAPTPSPPTPERDA